MSSSDRSNEWLNPIIVEDEDLIGLIERDVENGTCQAALPSEFRGHIISENVPLFKLYKRMVRYAVAFRGSVQFNGVARVIRGLIRDKKYCGDVSGRFIRRSALGEADMLIYAYTEEERPRQKTIGKKRPTLTRFMGFVVVQDRGHEFYIDLICAKGVGSQLVNQVKELAVANGKRAVTLSALSNVIPYYRKLGFKNTDHICNEDPAVTEYASRFTTAKFATTSAAESNPSFRPFLGFLVDRQLTADKSCRSVDDCAGDGFSMTWCVPSHASSPAPTSPPKRFWHRWSSALSSY